MVRDIAYFERVTRSLVGCTVDRAPANTLNVVVT